MEMMAEFLEERTQHHNVGIYEMDNLIMFVGDINCGVTVFRKQDEAFDHYIAKNIDAILDEDEEKIYEQVDIETFIDRICEQHDEDL